MSCLGNGGLRLFFLFQERLLARSSFGLFGHSDVFVCMIDMICAIWHNKSGEGARNNIESSKNKASKGLCKGCNKCILAIRVESIQLYDDIIDD